MQSVYSPDAVVYILISNYRKIEVYLLCRFVHTFIKFTRIMEWVYMVVYAKFNYRLNS